MPLDHLGKLRGGDKKIDQSGQSYALIWSYLQSLNKTSFLDGSEGKASPYNHHVKDKHKMQQILTKKYDYERSAKRSALLRWIALKFGVWLEIS